MKENKPGSGKKDMAKGDEDCAREPRAARGGSARTDIWKGATHLVWMREGGLSKKI